jgi:hypothetical protein
MIALVMEAVRTSEKSVDIYMTTRHYIPEDSELHTRRRENLKSHNSFHVLRGLYSKVFKPVTAVGVEHETVKFLPLRRNC